MASDIIADPQNTIPRKMRDNGDGSHTPYVYVDPASGGGTPTADVNINKVGGAAYGLGQTTASGSMPVVFASDQTALPLPTGAATAANQTTANTSLSTIATNTARATDNTGTATTGLPIMGVDIGTGTPHILRTDTSGRMKISHAQPNPTTGTIDAVASQIAILSDGFSDALFTFVPLGSHVITFEWSPDSTDGSTGTWFPAMASSQSSNVAAATTATITTVNISYRVSAPAAEWIRARVSTQTTPGSIAAQAIVTTAMVPVQSTVNGVVTMTSTTIAAPSATITGSTVTLINSAATTNATSLKSTQGRFLGLHLYNNGAAAAYFKLYNKASAPTVGTDVPVAVIGIAPNGSRDIEVFSANTYATGIAYAITGGAANTDTTAVAANQVVGNTSHV